MQSHAFGLELQARSITALGGNLSSNDDGASTDVHYFLVGTCVFGGSSNKVSLLEAREDRDTLECAAVWGQEGEVLQVASATPSTSNAPWFSAVTRRSNRTTATIYAVPSLNGELERKTTLETADVREIAWNPQGSRENLLALTDSPDGAAVVKAEVAAVGSEGTRHALPSNVGHVNGLAWDPHHDNIAIIAADMGLQQLDMRAGKFSNPVPRAHLGSTLSVDYNPNRMYVVSTSGDDGALRFWDLRNAGKPLQELRKHNHWANRVKYNPNHDQLMMSAGADFTAKLWHVPTVSSASSSSPTTAAPPAASGRRGSSSGVWTGGNSGAAVDGVVRSIGDFSDSVVDVAWSAASPWVYAALSFNGKVVVERVPQDVVMNILMSHDE